MYLIVGLGNPGPDYANTRHNVGFMVLDQIAEQLMVRFDRNKFKGVLAEGRIGGEKVLLLKPLTYMNLSGESIVEAVNFFKIPIEEVIVVFDDVSLDIGKIRIRKKGSAGGHNGVKSTISALGSDNFPRVKIGVGAAKHDLVKHVLGKFTAEEKIFVDKALSAAREAVFAMIQNSVDAAISEYNGFKAE